MAIAIFGLFSLNELSIDLLPQIDETTIMVMTAYNGASASDIETNVTRPLENVLNSVSDLKHLTSQSKRIFRLSPLNLSMVLTLMLQPTMYEIN